MPRKSDGLTIPDLVLLSLLAERPMHGYAAHVLLDRRNVREWAGVSKPQLYYSLEKLARLELIKPAASDESSAGPERTLYATTAAGRKALAEALEREDWPLQLERPPFLTWLALSWQARPGVFLAQVKRREEFLTEQVRKKQEILRAVRREVGHRFHEAVWMLRLAITQYRAELAWLKKLARESAHRAPARHPQYLGDEKK